MNILYAGELAAFGTVLCWTIGSQCFEAAGKQVGSLSVNLTRLVIAFLLFCLTLLVTRGELLPLQFPFSAWKWLLISGLIGFTFGDMCLFTAFVEIGPRLSMLIMALAAPITALIGWFFLEETYSSWQWLGVLVTLIGVSWVILLRKKNGNGTGITGVSHNLFEREVTVRGLLLAFGGAMGQAVGFIFSKIGMTYHGAYLDPFAATQIRVIGGTLGFVVLFFILGWWTKVFKALQNRSALGFMAAGSFFGPYLGVGLSLLALHYTTAGVASTIMSLVPIALIPFVIIIHKEHVSIHSFVGTLIAIGGVFMLLN